MIDAAAQGLTAYPFIALLSSQIVVKNIVGKAERLKRLFR
jgi:hypothetical protein